MAGAAIHSVRAVPPEHCTRSWPGRPGTAPRCTSTCPSSAPRTRPAARSTGVSPARLLYDEDVLGPRTTVVHATHVTAADLELLGGSQVFACLCPTTERDLGDGIGPGPPAGRGRVHAHPRQRQPRRHRHPGGSPRRRVRRTPRAGARAATSPPRPCSRPPPRPAIPAWAGPTPGQIAPGARADLVTVSLDSLRTAGAPRRPGPGDRGLRRLGRRHRHRRHRRPRRGPGRSPPAGPRRPRRAVPHDPRRLGLTPGSLTIASCPRSLISGDGCDN